MMAMKSQTGQNPKLTMRMMRLVERSSRLFILQLVFIGLSWIFHDV